MQAIRDYFHCLVRAWRCGRAEFRRAQYQAWRRRNLPKEF